MMVNRIPLFICLLIAIVISNYGSTVAGYDDRGRGQRPVSWQEDATINDVFFIDKKHGWAVGDQGLILRTTNGGLQWEHVGNAGLDLDDDRSLDDKLINMRPVNQVHELYPITCSLKSVCFINEHRGWIAGNYYTPLLNRSHCVILHTQDGGQTWNAVKNTLLPEINRIHFQHLLGGWALGGSSSLHQSGVLTTSSGGQSWSSQSIEPTGNFIDGELVPSGFVVVDSQYRLGKITGRQFESSVIIGEQPGRINAVRMLNAERGWAVGDGGVILMTGNGGLSWTHVKSSEVQRRQLRQFDFSTVSIAGDRVFVAGNPGKFLFSLSAATGEELTALPTGIQLPLEKLFFSDSVHGWAVGALGNIIATKDSGKTWRLQRGQRERVAILAVSGRAEDLPLAFLSRNSGEDRFVSSCVLAEGTNQTRRTVVASALNRVGCSYLTDIGQPDAVGDNKREMELLVRAIRTQQPNALVCSSIGGPSDAFVANCRSAIELAGSNSAFPDQIKQAGLSPWHVDRFVVRTKSKSEFTLRAERFLPTAGILLQDQIAIARALVGLSPIYRSDEHYRVESFTGSVNAVGDDIMYGLETLGKELPRREDTTQRGSFGSFATSPLKLEKLKQILKLAADPANQVRVENMIRGYGNGQDFREQGIWLWQLADDLQLIGKSELAAFTLDYLSSRFHHHPLTPAAMVWLANHYSSSEIQATAGNALRESLSNVDPSIQHASKIETSVDENGITQVKWEKNPDRVSDISQAEYIENAVDAVEQNRMQQARAFLNRLKQRDPVLALSEPVKFMEAKLAQKSKDRAIAENLFKSIRRTGDVSSPLRFASSRELRSTEEAYLESLSVCFAAQARPLLDGELDDEVWQNAVVDGNAQMRVVTPANASSPTNTDMTWLAYDDEFIYLAARCSIQEKHHCKPLKKVRTRDPDLSFYDRIRMEFDFDRDLQSTFVFEVDSCGRAAESCSGSVGWNPDWYVAVGKTAKVWTIECAIPLSAVAGDDEMPGRLIAYRLSRLDRNSIDLWSSPELQMPVAHHAGIVAGLRIEPKRYEFLRFAAAKPDSETAAKLP